MQVKATHGWFKSREKRTMIIERSAFSGLGEFGSRWLGDNFSRAPYMGYSVTGIMAHNVIGIPLAGSDICGFNENTTPELCARWHTVGAFYPFSRNHNAIENNPQEPYMFSEDVYEGTTTFLDVMRKSMRVKYSMVRYYYTQLHSIHRQGGSLYKPLFFEFPDDDSAYLD
jgi:alpha-glucosidase (family GH31 glycosyl hydrolase)